MEFFINLTVQKQIEDEDENEDEREPIKVNQGEKNEEARRLRKGRNKMGEIFGQERYRMGRIFRGNPTESKLVAPGPTIIMMLQKPRTTRLRSTLARQGTRTILKKAKMSVAGVSLCQRFRGDGTMDCAKSFQPGSGASVKSPKTMIFHRFCHSNGWHCQSYQWRCWSRTINQTLNH